MSTLWAPANDSTITLSLDVEGFELVVTGDGSAKTFPLPETGDLSIGRAEDATVRVESNGVSRRHALLRVRGAELTLEDLGSSNGTFVRGERVPAHCPVVVAPGESVLIGYCVLVVRPRCLPPTSEQMPIETNASGRDHHDSSVALRSPAMLALYRQTESIARAKINVLILGETGVGKDVLARSIHERSDRRNRPFLRLNCAALAEPLLESELFGHERGAFTGASQTKPGLLVAASGGTVFLDEIGELSPRLQPKLLQVIENQEVLSVGSLKPRPIDVRFIAATNRDLELEISNGAFRSDLYYRLAAFTVAVPPLRERREDILPLARELLRRAVERLELRSAPRFTSQAEALLLEHTWPGNVRELRNVIERAAVLSEGSPIGIEHLSLDVVSVRVPPSSAAPPSCALDPEPSIADLGPEELQERCRILAALSACAGNQSKAAEMLSVSRSTLLNRLDAYRISRPRKRPR